MLNLAGEVLQGIQAQAESLQARCTVWKRTLTPALEELAEEVGI